MSDDHQAVQPHLRKCFDALFKLEFGKEPGSVDVLAMISPENEFVQFAKPLKVSNPPFPCCLFRA